MKGALFVQLIEMAEESLGTEAAHQVLDSTDLASNGVYTSVGYYPCSEFITLAEAFRQKLGCDMDDLQRQFGHWVIRHFQSAYTPFFEKFSSSFDMLEALETEIHSEVRKLYPDAELPTFDTERGKDGVLTMTYRSSRPLIAFCRGMIEGCAKHFGEHIDIEFSDRSDANGTCATFILRRVHGVSTAA